MGIVTRAQPGEDDLLIGTEAENLIIKDLGEKLVKIIAPPSGVWTHDSLEAIDYYKISKTGWNAYLGAHWIGSSEV
ncbi:MULTISPECIES: hypothetical protein [unclassified Pseudoalteromonas]|uniref:hypothetical protein n=1 Tax=unclassified Pseudoalteromonas TaxID=194690 RepID=UPI001F269A32|nr:MULTISPECIES: hypothetical protein [unclassified Pseudoalteromonas]MCF2829720.1 hypothetical protein [Pseudoalteromonas sp. OF5H-5]MCF2832596.1 hypothetical protein [Pseudoalteromonas sp. DL2-H6]MCF2927610.1 hypothetical protein [Pseudoalteromonas sp. DL2-H1]